MKVSLVVLYTRELMRSLRAQLFVVGFLVSVLLLPVLTSVASVRASSTIPTPLAFYEFDQTTGDTTLVDSIRGNAGTGSVVNAPSFLAGKVGNALCFDGSTQYGEAPLVSGVASEFTISSWVRINTFTTWATIVKNWGSSNVGTFHLGINNATQNWSNFLGLTNNGTASVADSSSTTTGQWHHVVTTASQASGRIKLYVNNVKVDDQAFSGTITTYGSTMSFGVKLSDAQTGPASINPGWLDGCLDEVAFWDVALSDSQVGEIYTNGQSSQSPIPAQATATTVATTTTVASTTTQALVVATTVAPTTTTPAEFSDTNDTDTEENLPVSGSSDSLLFLAYVLVMCGLIVRAGLRTSIK